MSFNDDLIAVLPRLRRFARGLTGNATDADDLVQAVCERALTRAHQFHEGTRFDSWMFRIVQTIWIDELRSREVRSSSTVDHIPEHFLGSTETIRRAEARVQIRESEGFVNKLPEAQRTVFLLRIVEQLSDLEVARICGIPIGTVRSRFSRARDTLKWLRDSQISGEKNRPLPVIGYAQEPLRGLATSIEIDMRLPELRYKREFAE